MKRTYLEVTPDSEPHTGCRAHRQLPSSPQRRRRDVEPPAKRQQRHPAPLSPVSRHSKADCVDRWLEDCSQPLHFDSGDKRPDTPHDYECDSDLDAGPGSMQSRANTESVRSGSRSSSPSKKVKQPDYRARTLANANIQVDRPVQQPLLERLRPRSATALPADIVAQVAEELCSSARALIGQSPNEEEWQKLFTKVVDELFKACPGTLTQRSKRDWMRNLVPVAYVPDISHPVATKRHASGSFTARPARGIAPAKSDPPTSSSWNVPLHPLSNTPSLQPSTLKRPYIRATAQEQPARPQPDLTIGLHDAPDAWISGGLDSDMGSALHQHQLASSKDAMMTTNGLSKEVLISEPFATGGSGLVFPFLVVELKTDRVALSEAENQAAVSGACALAILNQLDSQQHANEQPAEVSNDDQDGAETVEEEVAPAHATPEDLFAIRTYSLTSSGPNLSLWAHIPPRRRIDVFENDTSTSTSNNPYSVYANGWDMVFLDSYRLTQENGARRCAEDLARVVAWGSFELRNWVFQRLAEIYCYP